MSTTWPQRPIGELCELTNGRAFKPEDWGKTGLPIVRIQNLNGPARPFNYYDGAYSDKHLVDTGEVLLSWSGTPGTSFGCFIWARGKALLNQHIFKVRVKREMIAPDYFVFAVNSKLGEMIRLAHGAAGLRHITKAKLDQIKLPVPPIEIQHRIVARIREALARAEELNALQTSALEQARAVLPSILNGIFTAQDGIAPSSTIGEASLETRYGTSRKCHSNSKGIPVLRIPNIAQGRVNVNDLKYCVVEDSEKARISLSNGDLLFVRTNGSRDLVGRCAVVNLGDKAVNYGFASYLIRVRVDQQLVDPQYLAYFLNSTNGRTQIDQRRRTSAGQFNINSENLRSITFPLPPLTEQQRLLKLMEEKEDRAVRLVAELESGRKQLDGLRESIIHRAFAGEL
jgi:type I restriction enzyme S subunit